jgi:hypothetical protein
LDFPEEFAGHERLMGRGAVPRRHKGMMPGRSAPLPNGNMY